MSKRILWPLAALLMASLACSLLQPNDETAEEDAISVIINSPADGSEVETGQEVMFQITINDPNGVVNRQELRVAGVTVATAEAVAPEGAPAFSIILPYTPTLPGDFLVEAYAFGSDGSESEPASMSLHVTGEAIEDEEETDGGTPTPQPTATVNPTPVPDLRGCTNDMRYVADVNIPDGTEMDPGETFTKTWTVRNSGTCDWGGYTLVYHSDNQMGGPSSVTVPATSAGQNVNVSVNLTAPATEGTHFSRWTMRSQDGDVFGNVIFVEIEVVGAGSGGDGPNLVVKSVTTNPDEPVAGQITQYTIEVENKGNEDAGASTLRGEFDTAGSATAPVPAVNAGAIRVVTLAATTPAAGTFDADFIADANDAVDESNESDNVLSTSFTYVDLFATGTLSTSEFSSFNFDGVAAHAGNCNGADDFHWEGDSPANRILTPCNTATIALMGTAQVGYDECSTASLGSAALDINGALNQWVCAETSDGRYVAFSIDNLGSAVDPLILSYSVYD